MIAGIFASTAAGVWYDPSDFSSMYQDSVGVLPVTAVEQPVGLMLDKSQGLVRGAELVGNGDFSDGSTGWAPGANWTITGGRAEVSNSGATSYLISTVANNTVITVGKFYEIVYTTEVTAGAIQIDCGGGNAPAANAPVGPITRRAIVRAVNTNGLRIFANATAVGWIDDISVREIPGNHILQATTTARPVLSARVNLLTRTEEITNAAWVKTTTGTASAPVVTDNFGVAPDGTTTAARVQLALNGGTTTSDYATVYQSITVPIGATFSQGVWLKTNDGTSKVIQWRDDNALTFNNLITVTGTWQFFRASGTSTTATMTPRFWLRGAQGTADSVDLLMWHPQTEAGSAVGRYQRVGVPADYNAVGFPLYLRFDGVDDYMTTPTAVPMGAISTFDVSCAFARKQNAAIAVLIEYGNGATAPDGSFAYFAPLSADTATNLFRLRGTVTIQNAVAQSLGVPVVMSARSVINSGFVMRYNAGTVATNGISQAGALADQVLYLGARAGATLPFKGRFYGLMIAGRRLSPDEMFRAERFLGQKSGVVL